LSLGFQALYMAHSLPHDLPWLLAQDVELHSICMTHHIKEV